MDHEVEDLENENVVHVKQIGDRVYGEDKSKAESGVPYENKRRVGNILNSVIIDKKPGGDIENG